MERDVAAAAGAGTLATAVACREGRATPALQVTLAGITFPTPVLAAPGPLEFGRQVQAVYDLRAFGGIITKSVSLEPRPGYPEPTVVETAAGWLNAVGLKNPGLAAFIARDLPFLRALGRPIIVSIVGHAVEEFAEAAATLDAEEGVAAVEVNVSCPNVVDGLWFGTDPQRTYALVAAVRRATRRPLFVKLSPNVTDIVAIARAAVDAGADALSLINTLQGLAVDARTRRPRLAAGLGGLSGPAIKPVALRMVWDVARRVRVPIIGMGGIQTAEDAVEFLLCGAHAVAVASGLFAHPRAAETITLGLAQFLVEQGVGRVSDLVGQLEFPDASPAAPLTVSDADRHDRSNQDTVAAGRSAVRAALSTPPAGLSGVAVDASPGTWAR